jgi:NAD(P)-dependent dehydrogenase (short-subunit alcohol dehydrogenase family)
MRLADVGVLVTGGASGLGAATAARCARAGARVAIIDRAAEPSIAVGDGVTGGAAYSASKAGVAGMTLPLARDLAPSGIRVVTIAPGPMDTAMAAGMPDAFIAQLEAETPFPSRFGRPDEFAALVEHVVTNEFLNGEVIRLDGALRMRPL